MNILNVTGWAGVIIFASASMVILADELDPVVTENLPRQLVVRLNDETNETTIFKTSSDKTVANENEALSMASELVGENSVITPTEVGELDLESSEPGWVRFYSPYYRFHYGYPYYYSYYRPPFYYPYFPYFALSLGRFHFWFYHF